jgi:hypothetical protein
MYMYMYMHVVENPTKRGFITVADAYEGSGEADLVCNPV